MNQLPKQPFALHLSELRTRLFWVFLSLLLGSVVGYQLSGKLITILVLPLHKQLYYTSPMGGFNFILQISLLFGMVAALPVVLYQVLKFLEPILPHTVRKSLGPYLLGSVLFLLLGISFAYFVSLPAALHFLGGFSSGQIQSLITAPEYYSFVTRYLVGFAVVFQQPLILLLVNSITPVTPKLLLRHQRLIIVGCFVLAAVFSPAVDPLNMTIMAVPLILLYYVSVLLVALVDRRRVPRVEATLPKRTKPGLFSNIILFLLIAVMTAVLADVLLLYAFTNTFARQSLHQEEEHTSQR